ncbi:MAG TPA: ABC-2 family transporter protein [Patescibacteria group bacterium]|nr:ABC-2 family transporter protein [Patescibacteria group bacterium]
MRQPGVKVYAKPETHEVMKTFKKYLKIWWIMSKNSFVMVISQKLPLSVFLIGKIVRFSFFFVFLFFILKGSNTLAGYTGNQVVFFFLTFSIIDVVSQFLFREVYRFRPMIVNGDFDFVLVKPINSLFRVLLGGADVVDLITIPPLLIATVYFGSLLNPSFTEIILYLALLLNGFLIATAFNIVVLSLAIITTEIDHMVMIYRDVTSLGRLPVDIYKEPLRAFITYLIPVGVMVTTPAKAAMGLVAPIGVITSFAVGIIAVFVSLKFWNQALTRYTSASS